MKHLKSTVTTLLLAVLLTAAVSSCKKNREADVSSPAYHINESESMVIPAAVDIPANLPNGNSRVATFFAEGVQKYKAQVKAGSPGIYEWVFVAPQAALYDAGNKIVGTHGAGPFWQLSPLDSIFAQHFSPAKTAASSNANSIDWLLLMPKAGKTATGVFANVAYIQRIATVGGKAPAVLPQSDTETAEVKYTAIYRFTKKN
ncbi:MAG TPA: hypothetical protein DCQ97_10150 [Chitinophagaceae bacterium]|nr:hypothetical protein [Chitinophagaceae bacterium]